MNEDLRMTLLGAMLGLVGIVTGDVLLWLTGQRDAWLPGMLALALVLPARRPRA